MTTDATTFEFYVSDNDRSNGWTNHGFALQLAFTGYGMGPQAALIEATTARREDYVTFITADEYVDGSPMRDDFTAIRVDNQHKIGHAYSPTEDAMSFEGLHREDGPTDEEFFAKELLKPRHKFLATAIVNETEFYAAVQERKGRVTVVACEIRRYPDYFNFFYRHRTETDPGCPAQCPPEILDLLSPIEKLYKDEDAAKQVSLATAWRDKCRRIAANT